MARYFKTSGDALIAGSLCGPLVILPGLALVMMLTPFFPAVIDEPIPIMLVFSNLGNETLTTVVQIAILGTFAATGAGLLHGMNERIANSRAAKNKETPFYFRAGLALVAMIFSIFLATRFGIIELVAKGFRYGAVAFLIVIFLPLVTRGFWMIMPGRRQAGAGATNAHKHDRGQESEESLR